MPMSTQEAADIDSEFQITLRSYNLFLKEPVVFAAVMERVNLYALGAKGPVKKIIAFGPLHGRDRHGVVEGNIVIHFAQGAVFNLGYIQRAQGAPVEFHS